MLMLCLWRIVERKNFFLLISLQKSTALSLKTLAETSQDEKLVLMRNRIILNSENIKVPRE